MSITVAVDPGVNAGVAIFKRWSLVGAFLVKDEGVSSLENTVQHARTIRLEVWKRFGQDLPGRPRRRPPAHLVVEVPQVYQRGKGDQNDLLLLALSAGAIAASFVENYDIEVHGYLPAQWKGQVPKDITKRRVLEELFEEEKALIELPSAKSLQHNVFDAIGLGMHHLKRK